MKLSVIVTALNEEKNILPAVSNLLSALADSGIPGEVIVVNDGSTDKTGSLISDLMRSYANLRLVTHDRPMGVGASFWDGEKLASSDVVMWFPGDNENDPWEIFRYFKLLEHVDIVIPFIFNKEVRSLFRNALSFAYRFIINTTFGVYFNYTNGTILYRKSMLDKLEYKSNSFFFQTDILIRCVKDGYLFAEVPYRLGLRKEGVSKAVTFPSFIKVVKGYLRLVRDIYFNKNNNIKKGFSADSITLSRRSGNGRELGTR